MNIRNVLRIITISDVKYTTGDFGTVNCPIGYILLTDSEECIGKAKSWFNKRLPKKGCWKFGAKGCVFKTDGIFFNTCEGEETAAHHAPLCVKGMSYLPRIEFEVLSSKS